MVAEGSTLARRALGRQLHALRKKAEVSQGQAARILGISPQTMGRIEDGLSARSANDLYMNTLCDHYGVSDENRRAILALAREVRATAKYGGGWWRAHLDRGPYDFDPRTMLENAAARLTVWEVVLLPSVVRTVDYRRAIAWTECPHLPTERIEARIEAEVRRQRRVDDPTFAVEIMVSEAAIREEWGGFAVMDEQRHHLVKIGQRSNVSIRVIPFNARSHIGSLVGSFSLLEFPMLSQTRMMEPPIVSIEEYTGELYLERAAEVEKYRAVLAELRRVALSESDSAALLLAISDEYRPR
ncbi:helix-turn-helix domain-containing protein [Nocardia sp. NPDC003482]